ncbi:MAG: MarR family transcriptional regulator [Crocinitomicaceae bacterium]|nr:MarR family transcriptional regulator [Crocinitomicaceae bacterium]MDG1658712.1 MarR family transcriptional regulator [Crocinitomicaceae bacterium]|tara:strand:- start:3523 stop:3990 length:468 start_codon:yes stop_codon:yes gene_type:complete
MAENKKEYLVDFVIRHLWHKFSRMYNQKAGEFDLTISSGFILLNVDKEGTPSTQLGPKMGMEPTSLSRTLKTMEERGLIYRKSDDVDKRKVLIFLTEEGVDKRRMARDFVLNFNHTLVESIPKGKLKTFFEVAEKLDASVDLELNKLQLKSSTNE